MAMSRDRVVFEIPCSMIDMKYRELLIEIFNYHYSHGTLTARAQFPNNPVVEITCRPSQFARFLIRRNDVGLRNGFKVLKARLVPAEPVPVDPVVERFDASGVPHND